MANEADFKFPATPGMPLFPLSPERVNKQSRSGVPPSPSLPNMNNSQHYEESNLLADSWFSRQNEEAGYSTPGSPSRRENPSPLGKNDVSGFSPPKHMRTNSDVQGMVARFNGLNIQDRLEEKIKKKEAALSRANMGREEAEAQVKELREEGRAAKRDLDESRDRERRVAKRLDVVMEDLHRSKETQAHSQTLFEKEIRKARKEAFKSSSILVKLQEELKAARATMKILQSDCDLEKTKAGKREQETFNAQYQLVGKQEELDRAQSLIKTVEEERDALKTNLKEEEVARVAAEGHIALPVSHSQEDDEFASPKKRQQPLLRSQSPEKEPPRMLVELDQLRTELEGYKMSKERAEEEVDFMRLECQFGCCSCRMAERQRLAFAHDVTFEEQLKQYQPKFEGLPTPPESMILEEKEHEPAGTINEQLSRTEEPEEIKADSLSDQSAAQAEDPTRPAEPEQKKAPSGSGPDNHHTEMDASREVDPSATVNHQNPEVPIETMPTSPTARSLAEAEHHVPIHPELIEVDDRRKSFSLLARVKNAAAQLPYHNHSTPLEHHLEAIQDDTTTQITHPPYSEQPPETPSTPHTGTWRTTTTTTKVPLAAEPSTPNYGAFQSPNITREQAIQQLRERRGRARSEVRTPKKTTDGAMTPRRDISAPEVRAKGTPRNVSRGRLVKG